MDLTTNCTSGASLQPYFLILLLSEYFCCTYTSWTHSCTMVNQFFLLFPHAKKVMHMHLSFWTCTRTKPRSPTKLLKISGMCQMQNVFLILGILVLIHSYLVYSLKLRTFLWGVNSEFWNNAKTWHFEPFWFRNAETGADFVLRFKTLVFMDFTPSYELRHSRLKLLCLYSYLLFLWVNFPLLSLKIHFSIDCLF